MLKLSEIKALNCCSDGAGAGRPAPHTKRGSPDHRGTLGHRPGPDSLRGTCPGLDKYETIIQFTEHIRTEVIELNYSFSRFQNSQSTMAFIALTVFSPRVHKVQLELFQNDFVHTSYNHGFNKDSPRAHTLQSHVHLVHRKDPGMRRCNLKVHGVSSCPSVWSPAVTK